MSDPLQPDLQRSFLLQVTMTRFSCFSRVNACPMDEYMDRAGQFEPDGCAACATP